MEQAKTVNELWHDRQAMATHYATKHLSAEPKYTANPGSQLCSTTGMLRHILEAAYEDPGMMRYDWRVQKWIGRSLSRR